MTLVITRLDHSAADLRDVALAPLAREPEQHVAIGAVAAAEIAAKEGDPSKAKRALAALGTGGKWAFGIAKDVGVHLAAEALKPHLGFPPG